MMTETAAPIHPLAAVVPTPWQVIALANGKGGVGKTSITANLAGLYGQGGFRVLLLELDPQGNLARDFGLPVAEYETVNDLIDSNGSQHAAALLLSSDTALPPLYENVRPNVDLIAGGGEMQRVFTFFSNENTNGNLAEAIRREILRLGRTYDLVLIDAPPIDLTALKAILRVAGTVIIPVRADDASIDGLSTIAGQFGAAQQDNPALRLGGVVRFGLGSRSTRVAERVQSTIEEILGGVAPIFDSIVRHSDSGGYDARRHGLLAYELESASTAAKGMRLAALKKGAKLSGDLVGTGTGTSRGLAEDYENLAAEVLTRVNELISENS
ncbi:ParA family protein [Mycolicibacterium goodii]|uniref:ParA family protein n=1 Tax=Mycolicibacterium goodii TaxID=134601 RepID=UPI000960B698|nr:ParA family protein [Mycolicibacterium goodii]MBU8841247.1 ParA family protein [Mycolicibacterium goodii]OKH68305.1 hypothetical protein EB74_33570 [Mycobacterium sp. SWH-M5]